VIDDAQPRRCEKATEWSPLGWAILLSVFLIGFANFPLRTIGANGDYLPGDAIDNRLNNFILEHGYKYCTGQVAGFWDAPMYAPATKMTASTDAHLVMLPFYVGLRALGFSPEEAFQGYFLILFVLNFATSSWVLRRLGFGPTGTAAGAFVFTFGLPLVAQLTHAQLFSRFLVPPAVFYAWEFLKSPRTWRLSIVAGCWVGQMYLTVYIAYFLTLLLAAGMFVTLLRFRRHIPWAELVHPGRRIWTHRGAVIAMSGLAVAPLLMIHGASSGRVSDEFIRSIAPRPGSWITPPDCVSCLSELGQATGLSLRLAGGELQLFPGLIPLISLVFGLILIARPVALTGKWAAVAIAAGSAILLGIVFTRFGDVWLYEPILDLPGGGAIRAVGRVVLVLLFPAAIAVAGLLQAIVDLTARIGQLPACLAAALALGLVVTDQWLTSTTGPRREDWEQLRYSREHAEARQNRLIVAISRHPNPRLVYVFPSEAEATLFGLTNLQIEAMRAAQDLSIPAINGYSGYMATGWDCFSDYRTLIEWLTVTNRVHPDVLLGLVVVGEPVRDEDPEFEAEMRTRFPPQHAP
jgi:hypothetical protein